MSIFDLFNTNAQQAAANAQITGINAGYGQLSSLYGQAENQLVGTYGQAVAPFQQAFSSDTAGANQYANLLGINGPSGNQQALQTLTNLPGYQFAQQQGAAATNANAQATGQTGGNLQLALQKQGQGLAQQNYATYAGQLAPYVGAQNTAAGGIGSLYGSLANQQAATSIGQGNAAYGAQTSIGNANANAQLAALGAGANQFGLLTGGLSGLLGLSNQYGGAGGLSSLSDKRVKEDIKPVGKLHDGQTVYRYKLKGYPGHQIGLIAQEVEKRHPDAVREIGGIKHVHYGKATAFAAGLKKFGKAA